MFRFLCTFFCLLSLAASADTIRLQGQEVELKTVDGRLVVSREDAEKAVTDLPPGTEYIELDALLARPDARVMRRDGKVTSILFHRADRESGMGVQGRRQVKGEDGKMYPLPYAKPSWEIQEQEYKRQDRTKVRWKQNYYFDDKRNRVEMLRDEVDRGKKKKKR